MKLFNILILVTAWLLAKAQNRLSFYQNFIDLYQDKGLGKYPNNQMNLAHFARFCERINSLSSEVTAKPSILRIIEIHIELLQTQIQYMREIDEMERSVNWFLLFDAMFFPKAQAW